MKELGEMAEEKTTNLSIQCPLHMTSCSHGGHSTTLIVCSEVWQVCIQWNLRIKDTLGLKSIRAHLDPRSACVNCLYSCHILYLWHTFRNGHTANF